MLLTWAEIAEVDADQFGAVSVNPLREDEVDPSRGRCARPGCGCVGLNATGGKLRACSVCHSVFFCGRECMKRHWPVHKLEW